MPLQSSKSNHNFLTSQPPHDIVLNNHKYTDSIEGYSLPANTNINSAAVLALEFGRQMQIAAQRQPNKLNKSLGKPVKNCNWFRFSARPLLAICNKSVKVEWERGRARDWQILNMAVGYKLRRPECPTGFTWLAALAGHNLCPDWVHRIHLPTLYAWRGNLLATDSCPCCCCLPVDCWAIAHSAWLYPVSWVLSPPPSHAPAECPSIANRCRAAK